MTMDLVAREDWVSACQFHELDQPGVLRKVLDAVRAEAESGKPIVIFDLDSTLYNVAPRTQQILKEWLSETHQSLPLSLHKVLVELSLEGIGYSWDDTFRMSGLDLETPDVIQYMERLRDFWHPRFFSNPYLQYDVPYAGAPQFVHEVYRLGGTVVYLTARSEAAMRSGTEINLRRDGFPWNVPRTHLFLKENSGWDDLRYKQETAKQVCRLGHPVASFENEPRNVAGFLEVFPEALHVFMDSICSTQPAQRCEGLYRITSFLR